MIQRLHKLMAQRGIASRRACEELIRSGRVTVNGIPALLGQSVDDAVDEVRVDGVPLREQEQYVYVLLNKPRGYVTTMHDEKGRRTVADLVAQCPVRVFPVGRLDYDSEGLLLMTNDGELANRLTHPSYRKEKTYHVSVLGDIRNGAEKMLQPMAIDGRMIAKPDVKILEVTDQGGRLSITIHEGRNRQIRKMCEQCALKVCRLIRISMDTLTLGPIRPGQWRYLTQDEIDKLKMA